MKNFDKEELMRYFTSDNSSGWKSREKHVMKKYKGLLDEINDFVLASEYDIEIPFTQKLYNYLFDIIKIQRCVTCGEPIKWKNRFSEGYRSSCSVSCKHKSKLRLKKMYETNEKKYGVQHFLQNENLQKKRWETVNKKIVNKFKDRGYVILSSTKNELKIKHPDGHVFSGNRKLLINRLNGGHEISTTINPIHSIFSTYEQEIKDFLNSINCVFRENDRKLLNGKEIDIFIPKHNLGIEFNGLFWHSDLYVDDDYHYNKTKIANSKGIQILHVFEDEWVHRKNIVKSIILAKMGQFDQRIYARKCVIKEIGNNESEIFLNTNHIQGSIGAKFKYGLYYNGELVSIMTFGKLRKALGGTSSPNQYEMLRFCNKLRCQVIGGASKLLNRFVSEIKPEKIVTYADKRYSNGNLYSKLNFLPKGETKPNYWYVDKNNLLKEHRFNYRKNVLVEQGFGKNKTEREIMHENDKPRIYDCGNLKYEMLFPQP